MNVDGPTEQVVSLYRAEARIQPRSVRGWYASWRWVLVWLTQLVFYGLPWLHWNGRQAVLFDLGARRFYLLNLVFYPQDFIYLTGLLVLCAYGLFLFTAVGGRLWCGYACPQTVYTEIFLWIEHRFEGDRSARLRLDQSRWDFDKTWRRAGKHVVWLALAGWTGFTFVGYFTPIAQLGAEVLAGTLGPWEGFWIVFYGFATYGNAGFMREQVCKYMCPYARFQSAMFDRDTLVIGYDARRGEPRGARPRNVDAAAAGLGSCIDCTLCVQVCPTGIDIRRGLQYECIGCAACIDACDSVMDRTGQPRGLVRYATENAIDNGWSRAATWRRVLRPRILIYTTVLALIATGVLGGIALRSPLKVDVVRDRAALARIVEQGRIENVYRLQLMNATEAPQQVRVAVDGLPGIELASRADFTVDPAQARWVAIRIQVAPQAAAALAPGAHPIRFVVDATGPGGMTTVREKSTFVLPR